MAEGGKDSEPKGFDQVYQCTDEFCMFLFHIIHKGKKEQLIFPKKKEELAEFVQALEEIVDVSGRIQEAKDEVREVQDKLARLLLQESEESKDSEEKKRKAKDSE